MRTIRECDGTISEIAKRHGMTYFGGQKRIKFDPELMQALEDTREQFLDIAESPLFQAIRAGNMQAVRFYFETKGKSRGYGRHVEVGNGECNAQVIVYIPHKGGSQPTKDSIEFAERHVPWKDAAPPKDTMHLR